MKRQLFRSMLMVFMLTATLSADGKTLDEQIAAFEDASATQSEAQLTALLKAGVSEKRSAEALAAVQPWLNRNNLQTQQALFYAGQTAEHSGQLLAAVGYYQRLLQMPKPDAKLAGHATDATYRLLLNAPAASPAPAPAARAGAPPPHR